MYVFHSRPSTLGAADWCACADLARCSSAYMHILLFFFFFYKATCEFRFAELACKNYLCQGHLSTCLDYIHCKGGVSFGAAVLQTIYLLFNLCCIKICAFRSCSLVSCCVSRAISFFVCVTNTMFHCLFNVDRPKQKLTKCL